MTQTDSILIHLKSGKSITPLEALELWGCFRLGARVNDLRREGYEIETEIIEQNGKRFARYSMKLSSADQYKVQTTFLTDNQFSAA